VNWICCAAALQPCITGRAWPSPGTPCGGIAGPSIFAVATYDLSEAVEDIAGTALP
jgi:hypothetical protein